MAGGKITLREAQTIAYLLEHGRLPDRETAEWFERRTSRPALEYLLMARLRGAVAAERPTHRAPPRRLRRTNGDGPDA